MGILTDKINKLREYTPERMAKEVLNIAQQNQDVITQMNTDQLYEGKASDGRNLPDYSPVSVAFYGKPEGPIRLFDQGDFYRGFFTRIEESSIHIDSDDSKTAKLVSDYGEKIFGLVPENQKSLNKDYLLDPVRNLYRSIL